MKKLALLLAAVCIVAITLLGSFIWDGFLIAPGPEARSVEFTIEPGLGLKQISAQLKNEDLINSRFMFETYARMSGKAGSFKAGSFELSTGMSYAALTSALTRAESSDVQITIPEGFTLAQIGESVRATLPHITEEDWEAATGSESLYIVPFRDLFASLPEGHDLEGYLFPDTYRFGSEASARAVAEVMLTTLERRLADAGYPISDFVTMHGLSFHELMTLASIVEREARSREDMKLVAGVFLTRLEIGMALQSDATVTYITGGKDPSPTFEETRVESPYNTYRILGLPPGPISSPGMNAILAVIDPTESDYLYFLTAPDGTFHYSKTFNEHVEKKHIYLK